MLNVLLLLVTSKIEAARVKGPHLDTIIEIRRVLCWKKISKRSNKQLEKWKNSPVLSWTCWRYIVLQFWFEETAYKASGKLRDQSKQDLSAIL